MKKLKIDSASWFIIALFFIILGYVVIKRNRLRTYALYTKGVSLGTRRGIHEQIDVHYFFTVDGGDTVKGYVPLSFTNKFKYNCQKAGDTVLIRYESDNPKNNELIAQFPKGMEP